MSKFIVTWAVNIIALVIVVHTVAGVSIDSWQTTIVAALVLGLLNAFLRPVLVFATLPLSVASLGFFTLVINGAIFYLAARFVPGFTVTGFWSAFWAAIIFSVISFLLNLVFGVNTATQARFFVRRPSRPPDQPRYTDTIDVEGKIEK